MSTKDIGLNQYNINKPGYGWTKVQANIKNDTILDVNDNFNTRFYCMLCNASDLPSWHFKHRGLISGYRQCNTLWSTIYSLFYWHNESVNVWSHLLSSIALFYLSLYFWDYEHISIEYNELIITNNDNNLNNLGSIRLSYRLLFLSNLLGNVLPIFLSAFCHQFYCINKLWHIVCWYLDFIGILTGMFFTGCSFIYIVFYCNPMIMYTILYGLIICYINSLQICWRMYYSRMNKICLVPSDRFPEFSKVLSIFGLITTIFPVVIAILTCIEYREISTFRNILYYSVLGPIVMALGIVCFAQGNFPERYTSYWKLSEDYFDFIGHSHQLWHLLSAGLQFCWIIVLKHHYNTRIQYGCSVDS